MFGIEHLRYLYLDPIDYFFRFSYIIKNACSLHAYYKKSLNIFNKKAKIIDLTKNL